MKKKKLKLKKIRFGISSFITVSFMMVLLMISIGFSSLTTTLSIDGKTAFEPIGMIRIMSIEQDNLVDATENGKRILSPDGININLDIEELSGTASYNVVIKNLGQTKKQLVDIEENIFSNDDMEYRLVGLEVNDVINPRSEVSFKIIFKYKDEINNITETRLNSELRFVFEDYTPIDAKAYFMQYNGENDLFGFDKTNITSFERNTTLTLSEVLNKSGVTIISNETNDNYHSDYQVYGWVENNKFYWWSEAELVYFHPDTFKAFSKFSKITTINLTGTSTEKIKNFAHFFDTDRVLKKIIGKIDTSGLELETTTFDFANDNDENSSSEKGVAYMFNDCNALTSVDLTGIDTTNAIDMKRMFGGCRNLGNIDISHFNTSNARSMYWMFRACNAMTNIDLSSFDTGNVESFNGMFLSATKVKTISFGDNFNTSSAANMARMFEANSSLTTIYASLDFIRSNNLVSNDMFKGATKLVGAAGYPYETKFNSSKTNKAYAQIASSTQSGYFTSTANYVKYTITYELNGASNNNPSYYTETSGTFKLNYPEKLGYIFLGWTGSNGETPEKDVTITDGTTGNLSYTAHFEPITYEIIYNGNGAIGTMENQVLTYDQEYTLSQNLFRYNNNEFIGWNTKQDGTGNSYTDMQEVRNLTTSSTLTLYAQWVIDNTSTVVFNVNGPCILNGENSNITGSTCQNYANDKFINSNVSLYSNDNYDKDFEVLMNIDHYSSNEQEVSQATLLNEMWEVNGKSTAGFLVRREYNNLYFLFRGGSTYQEKFSIPASSIYKIRIVRKNNNICYSINDQNLKYVYNFDNFDKQFDIPLYYGAADNNGTPWRYVKGTFSDMIIKIGTDDSIICDENTQ